MILNKRILVVDDEKLVCESCSSILSEQGHDVQTTMSARDGLRRIGQERFDLVLVDLRMPDIDGIELIEKAKATAPDVAMVVITGYPSVDTAVRTVQLGALQYISKPFTPDELVSAVAKALQRYEHSRASREPRTITVEAVGVAIEAVRREPEQGAGATTEAPVRSGVITVDLNACMACLTCVLECGQAHLPSSDQDHASIADMFDSARVHVEAVGTHCVPMRCQQCDDPPCAKACPTGAISRCAPDRPVTIDDSRCIGCKSCMLVCPFGAIYVNGKANMVVKCDQCVGIIAPGEEPVCVTSCPAGAVKFIPVREAAAETRRKAARDFLEASLKGREPGLEMQP